MANPAPDALIRAAGREDDRELALLDNRAWTKLSSPAGRPPPERPFFGEDEDPQRVLLAERNGRIVGWVRIRPPTPLAANAHVREIAGLAVDPDGRRAGVAGGLMRAAEAAAIGQGATRMTLRVFGPNRAARALYESLGYVVEGVLPGEFIIDGETVDDVLMGKSLP
jgi:ribosomal protein S18 acetylase RimI-like enzyme